MPMVEIYGLFDPETDELRYIGKANNSAKRLKGHLRDARRRRTPVYDWINSLAKRGLFPFMRVLSTVSEEHWKHEEKRLIFESRLTAPKLLNLADGGDQPKCSTEQRSRNGFSTAKALHSDPVKKRIWKLKQMLGFAIKKGHISNEAIAKLRESAKKRPDLFGCWANLPDRKVA